MKKRLKPDTSKRRRKRNIKVSLMLYNGRGSASTGNSFVVVFIILLMTLGVIFVGGVAPSTLSKAIPGKMTYKVTPAAPKTAQNTLQMYTFTGKASTPLPGPTLTPTDVPCVPGGGGGSGTLPPSDILKQPFSKNSIWNTPIGSGAKFVAIQMEKANSDKTPQVDDERIVLKPQAPMTPINHSSGGWGGDRCSSDGGVLITVPIPADYVVPNDNDNSSAAFLMPDGHTIMQSQPLARCKAGGPGTSLVSFTPTDINGDGIPGAHGGSNLSAIGGSIRVGELRPGQIGMRHAIKINVNPQAAFFPCKAQADCFRWPASKADSGAAGSYGGQTVPGMKMGALLAIPSTTSIATLGLESEPGKELAWTLQNYGAYIVDSTGGLPYAINGEVGPDGSIHDQFQKDYGYPIDGGPGSSPWARDFAKLMQALQLVDNNSPTSIGGGGTPLQPLLNR